MIARALHNLSARRERTFVKLNCAAIPTGLLLEERTLRARKRAPSPEPSPRRSGDLNWRTGDDFSDEVGRSARIAGRCCACQEQEFERLGSTRTMRVNVRVIAATNRDLSHMVDAQQFRSDLYYRLKVFPVTVPPLRERVEDIPVLRGTSSRSFASRMKSTSKTVPTDAPCGRCKPMDGQATTCELENFVRRAVIPVIRVGAVRADCGIKTSVSPSNGVGHDAGGCGRRDHIINPAGPTTGSSGDRPAQLPAWHT